jgi:hypothetical protein
MSFNPLKTKIIQFAKKKTTHLGCSKIAWRRPTLTGGIPQLPSAQRSLTSVFGMGTGVTFLPSPPDCIHKEMLFAYANSLFPQN